MSLKIADDFLPTFLLIGADCYRHYHSNIASKRSLELLNKSFSKLSKTNGYKKLVNGKFSRPRVLSEFCQNNISLFTVIYYFGHTMGRRDGKVFLAHPASNPRKTSSHIFIDDIVKACEVTNNRKLLLIIDSDDYSLKTLTTKKNKNVLFVFRRLKNSKTNWRNGGELFTGCFAETIADMHEALPQISFHQLFSIISRRLGYNDAEDCFLFCGDEDVVDQLVFSIKKESGLWFSEQDNFESENRGSREDGIQVLADALNRPEDHTEALSILEFLAATDQALQVRRTAKGLMFTANQINFNINKQFDPCLQLGMLLPEWIIIPSGPFIMGSSDTDGFALPEEKPEHKVFLTEFWIAKITVTIRQWKLFLQSNKNEVIEPDNTVDPANDDLPVTGVNWYEAIEYAKWLTMQCQIHGFIRPDEEIRLPTEAEWEKAARGQNRRLYPWGDQFEKGYCNCRSRNIGHIVKSGLFSPEGDSPYGVQDMAGNVWEWTISLWGQGGHKPEFSYPYCKFDGRENIQANKKIRRIVRGGAFYYFDYCLRVATRNVMHPEMRHSGGGIRLVKVQKQ